MSSDSGAVAVRKAQDLRAAQHAPPATAATRVHAEIRIMKINQRLVAAPLIALACIAGVAQAQEWGGPRGQGVVIPRADLRLDGRYQLNRYYPPQGYVVAALPRGAVAVAFGGLTYYYHAGVWFQPSAGHYVVAMPPPGAVIPTLPAAYATLSFNGVPYYYANETYYIAAAGPGYAVVSPPPDAAAAQPVALVRPARRSCPNAWCKSTARRELRCAVLSEPQRTAEWAQYR